MGGARVGRKGDVFQKGDWSQTQETLDAKLVIWGHRKPLKVFDSNPIKAVF